jgi:hypothetical protein
MNIYTTILHNIAYILSGEILVDLFLNSGKKPLNIEKKSFEIHEKALRDSFRNMIVKYPIAGV